MAVTSGAEGTAGLIAAALAANLPAALSTMRAAEGLTLADLPDVGEIRPSVVPRSETSVFPVVMVEILDLLSLVWEDEPAAGPIYTARYAARVWGYVRGQEFADTTLAVQRLALAVRTGLLAGQKLADPDTRLEQTSWRESYSAVEARGPQRSFAGFFAAFDVLRAEQLLTPTLTEITATHATAGAMQ